MKSTLDILTETRDLIADKDHWTTGSYARDSYGSPTFQFGDEAVCWCVRGAIERVAGLELPDYDVGIAADSFLSTWAVQQGYRGLIDLNDRGGHSEVMKVLDIAIQRLQKTKEADS